MGDSKRINIGNVFIIASIFILGFVSGAATIILIVINNLKSFRPD